MTFYNDQHNSLFNNHLCQMKSHFSLLWMVSVQFSSVAQSCLTLCDPMDCTMPGYPVYHQLPELAQIHVHRVDDTYSNISFSVVLLLLPSIFPSIRVFSNESLLCTRWPKYWSFRFSIRTSNEYSGLISIFRSWFDLLCCSRDSQESSPAP